MKQVIIFSFLAIFIWSCNKEQSNICHLTGKLINAPDTTVLFLENRETLNLIDSIVIIKGIIDYKFSTDQPTFFLLHKRILQYSYRDWKFLWLEPSKINIEGDYEFLGNLKVNGSQSHSEFEAYNLLVESFNKKINVIKEQIHFKSDEEKKRDTLLIDSINKNLSDSIVDFMLKHPSSYAALYLLSEEITKGDRHLNKNQFRVIYDNLVDNFKESPKGIEIRKYIELPEPPKVGDKAIEIAQTTPNGDTVKLSDFRGKYLLLDFWSSGCGPCRSKHKPLRIIYEKYKTMGFEILSVSGDYEMKPWVNAIKNDSITWTQVSDLRGWKNEAFLLYDVRGIPQSFLLDTSGLIIKQDIGFSLIDFSLEKELEKIFKGKEVL